jgi:hypothetical protein
MKIQVLGMIGLALLVGSAVAQVDKEAAYMKKFDTDGDGKLSSAEHKEMTKTQFAKKGIKEFETEDARRFKYKDTNADGFITLEEYKVALAKNAKKKSEKESKKETP